MKIWRAESTTSDFTLDVRDDRLTCERKGFILYGQPVVPDDLVENQQVLQRNGTWFSNIQAESSGSGFSECMFEQNCEKLCYFAYRHVCDGNRVGSWMFCEVGFL